MELWPAELLKSTNAFTEYCEYLRFHSVLVILLVPKSSLHAKKSPNLLTFQLLLITVCCMPLVTNASLRQGRQARDAWHEIRRQPPTHQDGDYLTFEHHHLRTNRETGEHYALSYKLRRHRHLYVNFDDTSLLIQEVVCTAHQLRTVVTAEVAFDDHFKTWTYPLCRWSAGLWWQKMGLRCQYELSNGLSHLSKHDRTSILECDQQNIHNTDSRGVPICILRVWSHALLLRRVHKTRGRLRGRHLRRNTAKDTS